MPTMNTATLVDLYRHGDFAVTDNGHEVVIDLTVRRSGCTLYGSGDTLDGAISDVWRELEDHFDALEHLEGLGINVADVGLLTDGQRPPDRLDSDAFSYPPIATPADYPVAAAAGEPIDTNSPGYILALLIPVREGRA